MPKIIRRINNNNLSQVLRQEAVTFGINPEGIKTPSGKSKSTNAISQIKNSLATLTSTLESCYYRDAPPSKQWVEWYEKIATSKREVQIEEVLTDLTDQRTPSVGILAAAEGNQRVEIVVFHGLEKPQSATWSNERWYAWWGETVDGHIPNTYETSMERNTTLRSSSNSTSLRRRRILRVIGYRRKRERRQSSYLQQ